MTIEVDAEILYWTPDGMQRRPRMGAATPLRYVEATEVVRLLEEAHARGYRQAKNEAETQTGAGYPRSTIIWAQP